MPSSNSVQRKNPWITLDNPKSHFDALVPKILRIDEARIGKSSYQYITDCHISEDSRMSLKKKLARPNRWICKLQVGFRNPKTGHIEVGFGSGLLIDNRFVLTAAHVLMEEIKGNNGKFQQAINASSVIVIPGLDGRGRQAKDGKPTDTMPFAWTYGVAFRTAQIFHLAMHASGATPAEYDYAVIKLAEPIGEKRFDILGGSQLGYWSYPQHKGQTLIRVKPARSLKNVKVNAAGYPNDKCKDRPVNRMITQKEYEICRTADLGSVQWYSFDRIRSVQEVGGFSVLKMENDVAHGMSGGPVWLRWQRVRNLIGILHACDPIKSKKDPFMGSFATQITSNVKRDVKEWISNGPT